MKTILSLQKKESKNRTPVPVFSDIYTDEKEGNTHEKNALPCYSLRLRPVWLLNRDRGGLHGRQSAARSRSPHPLELPAQSADLHLLHLDDP